MKTILLLVSVFAVTLSSFTHTTQAFAQRHPRHQHPHPPQRPSQQPSQQPAGPTLDQLKAKDFTVRTLDGQSVSLNTLLGEGKPVLIDFWATWCGPCRMVIPHLGAMHRKYGKDGLVVIGMNLEDPGAEGQAVRNFVERYRMDYQNVFVPHAIYQFFSGMAVARIPYTLLFGPDGRIMWRLVGFSPQMNRALDDAIAKAIAAAQEKPAEQLSPEKPAEQIAPEKPAEQSTPKQVAPEKPAEQGTPEKSAEQVAPEKTAEQRAPEKPVEQIAPEKPAVQSQPEKKTCECGCPCCSSPAPEEQTERGASEKQ
jgi:cytochrome c biogenesis protein CcmG, thiol:disulfide interchange protein DsbE